MTKVMHNDNLDKLTGIVKDAVGLLSRDEPPASGPAPRDDSSAATLLSSVQRVDKVQFSEECVFSQSSEIGEKFRELRTNIQTLSSLGKVKTFVFSSCHHHEGKTHTTINTARFMAQYEGRKILLVDCDMRRPTIKDKIDFDFKHGLEDVLSERCRLEDALVHFERENLTVLPTLSGCSDATELLESTLMDKVLQDVRAAFDHVFIDTSPVLSTTDPLVIGAKVDGVILTVQAGTTQRDTVEHAIGLLRQANVRILGVVLTQMKNYLPKYLHRYHYFRDLYADYYRSDADFEGKSRKTKKRRRSERR
ncbi:MAG: CpsD/CapB family tyrosine-protein kinase [Planctomycetota bacterium]